MVGLKEVAARAGVSARTVSRVMRGEVCVAEETRARIRELADSMGYRPNLAARGLRSRRTHEVVLVAWTAVVFNEGAEIHLQRVAGLENRLREEGVPLKIRLEVRDQSAAQFIAMCEDLALQQPVGVVFFAMEHERLALAAQRLHAAEVPLVALDQPDEPALPGVRTIAIDRQQGIAEAVHHLAATGRRRIVYAGVDTPSRVQGYRRAMQELGLPPRYLFLPPGHTSPRLFEQGLEVADRLAAMSPRPDAVQAYSDALALGIIARTRERGLAIPTDLAVVGFDDRSSALLVHPRLTTVALPNQELGRAAAEYLLRGLIAHARSQTPIPHAIPTRLVIRDSA